MALGTQSRKDMFSAFQKGQQVKQAHAQMAVVHCGNGYNGGKCKDNWSMKNKVPKLAWGNQEIFHR